jgi:KUP system potassium uptake protein
LLRCNGRRGDGIVAQPKTTEQGAENGPGNGAHGGQFWTLLVGCIGVVYGDIGTSPLYAFREAVDAARGESFVGREAVFGVLSLITWALILIITLKYILLVLRADNKGEGGTFALMALAQSVAKRSAPVIMGLGIAGASFFFGDAVITPAISVVSAVEGISLISPAFEGVVVPLAVVILIALYAAQSRGTAKVAMFFGPITIVWFITLMVGGLLQIIAHPDVLVALNPWYGMRFLLNNGLIGFTVLGLTFLAVTGAEALYTDLGHFGRKPIQVAWLCFIFPALLCNYYGQGALVLQKPEAIENTFYLLYPGWALVPVVILATAATVVASQAVITGAFSVTRQAIQLGLLPRFAIKHTSESMAGQIYLPRVNWIMLTAVLLIVVLFRNSSNLASAYGVAISAQMIIESLIAFFVIWRMWGWRLWQVVIVIVPFLFLEQAFFAANTLKIFQGAWVTLAMSAVLVLIMFSWVRGSRILAKNTRHHEAELGWLVRKLEAKPPTRVPGTAVFLSSDVNAAPTALMHNLKHNRILHERNIVLSIRTEDVPRVPRYERVEIDRSNETFIKVMAFYGFMESPSVPKILESCRRKDLKVDLGGTSFFLSRRSLRPTRKSEMPRWQGQLFVWLARTSEDATTYFQIPTDRVVEVGTQVTV